MKRTKLYENVFHLAAEAERIALASRISVCSEQLGRYNTQLEEESNRRNQLSLKLRAYQMKLRERMKEAEAEIEVSETLDCICN